MHDVLFQIKLEKISHCGENNHDKKFSNHIFYQKLIGPQKMFDVKVMNNPCRSKQKLHVAKRCHGG